MCSNCIDYPFQKHSRLSFNNTVKTYQQTTWIMCCSLSCNVRTLSLAQAYSKLKWNVVVTRGFSYMNEWLKCMESQMLLKNFWYSVEHCIAPMQGPVWF